MAVKTQIKTSQYHDSVSLMLVARQLVQLPDVTDAAVVMGTEANKAILRQAGLLTPDAEAASPNDLIIAVKVTAEHAEQSIERALAEAEKLLQTKSRSSPGEEINGGYKPRTLRAARNADPSANVAVISVAGRYAADEAWAALQSGLHVLLFSDNVSLEDEVALKHYARNKGLLLMGPGAGTAILNGAALGFANVVPRGPIGIVSAAGTGLQEVSTLLAKQGLGLTQGIGTGGRDLKEQVGGIMMLAGLQALQQDPDTLVIVLVSKPPAELIARKVLEQVGTSPKPTIVCLLGGQIATLPSPRHVIARTLEEAASLAAAAVRPELAAASKPQDCEPLASELRTRLKKGQRCLRGLFSGGTLCYEAQVIWSERLSEPVLSNAPLNEQNRLSDSTQSQGHTAVDLGEEEFTVGRPHPMINNDLRIRRLLQEAQDPETAVIMLDVVLGYGAHPDPAAELGPAVRKARQVAGDAGGELVVVASVTGTEDDPQQLSRQVEALEQAGAIVCSSNAAAARLVAGIVQPET